MSDYLSHQQELYAHYRRYRRGLAEMLAVVTGTGAVLAGALSALVHSDDRWTWLGVSFMCAGMFILLLMRVRYKALQRSNALGTALENMMEEWHGDR
jgi:hypothetical protein